MSLSRRRATALMIGSALPLGGCTAPTARKTGTGPTSPGAGNHVRRLALHGAVNLRDLGGYRTTDGRQVVHGRLFRSDALGKLTASDVAELAGLRLRTVVDLRTRAEREAEGPDRLPHGLDATLMPVDDRGLFDAMQRALATKDPDTQRERLGGGRAELRMREIYPGFVTRAANRAQFARILDALAHERSLPLLFHCTSGKDRTGWLSYLLLRLLGVPHATAEGDYLLSNTIRRRSDATVRAGLEKAGIMSDPDLLIPLQEVRADYLAAGLHQVRKDYGSLRRYLARGLGVDAGTQDRIRDLLLR